MKRTLFLSLGLIVLANAMTINSAQAIDWKKVKKCSFTALKVVGCAAIVAGIIYAVKCAVMKSDQNIREADMAEAARVHVRTTYGPISGQWNPYASVYCPKTVEYADGSVQTWKAWEISKRA